jgi:multiple antibiotic resistance protein
LSPAVNEFFTTLPRTFIPLFVAVDVAWLLPLFAAFTAEMEDQKRKVLLKHSLMTALLVSLGFVAVGELIFALIGITTNDFKVAGGLILLALSVLDIIIPNKPSMLASEHAGVVPLGVPLIAGPTVLTTILVLVDHYGVFPTVVSLILNLLLVWVALGNAHRIIKALGTGIIHGVSKIMAILLASIAVMMIRLGIEGMIGR